MLEGLEIVEVLWSKLVTSASTLRFDSEYFQKKYLAHEALTLAKATQFSSFADLGLEIDGSAFYPSIEPYYNTGSFPFLRVADVDSVIDFKEGVTIPEELCDIFPTLKKVVPGDVVLTKGGSVGRVGLVTREAAACRDLIFINSSKLTATDSGYFSLYLQTSFANDLLIRSSSMTAQPHLTLTLVRELPIFWPSADLRSKCWEVLKEGLRLDDSSIEIYAEAEALLLDALGLINWQPATPLAYEQPASVAFASGRLDAEYYQPKHEALLAHLKLHAPRLRRVREFAATCSRGELPVYDDEGKFSAITSKHILETGLDYDNFERTNQIALDAQVQPYDVLTYMTGANVGRTAVLLEDITAQVSGDVNILRLKEENPVYVAVVLNSIIGRQQTYRTVTGSAQAHLYSDDIANFVVPFVAAHTQAAIVAAVEAAHTARRQAKRLLEAAKRAVEVAIEEGEAAALAYLETIQSA